MHISELSKYKIPDYFIEKFKEEKIENLYPPQADAIKHGLLDGKSIVLSVPTAAGKTLAATLAAINKLSEPSSGVKVVYIVPLVALANEKYNYYKKLFCGKWQVAISVGDLDSADPWLARYDFIVCTTEKLDSLIRHGSGWVKEIGLVIVDEVHMLNDISRGPTLEILITRLRDLVPNAQILALSATISNANELAEWMTAELVVSDFRPVKLFEGVSFGDKIHFLDKDDYAITGVEQENSILENTLNLRKQALFFVSSRRNAESLAQKLTKTIRQKLNKIEREQLAEVSEDVLNVLETPTSQCRKLADCIKHGSAFHHAGLLRKQKQLIEEGFRAGLIKSISATPTLAMGVNLPAFRVIIRDSKRYYGGRGMSYIPILEYKQFVGRAGRPQYDDFGESILVARTEGEADELVEHFIMGEPEKIRSKLAVEPVLRMHTLALISSGFVKTEKALLEFFSKSFYAYQYGDISAIEEKLLEILELLKQWEFISTDAEKLAPTRMGRRVTELYLDPLTAHNFIDALKLLKSGKRKASSFGFMHTISDTIEMMPLLSVRSGEFTELNELIAEREHMFLQRIPQEWDLEFDRFLQSIKTATLFEDWSNEKTEDQILENFKVAPGELPGRLQIADWLIYSLQELALLLGLKDVLKDIRKTRVRLKYGIREELIPLIRLKLIGRVRARRLFKANLKTVDDLRKASLQTLSKIIGPSVAYSVKEQLGEKLKESERPERPVKKSVQSKLGTFKN